MRTFARVVAPLATVALFAAGCGGSSTSTDNAAAPTTGTTSASATSSTSAAPTRQDADLVIWCDSQLKADAVKPLADKFASDNGITAAVQVVASDLQTAFVTADAAGNGPDIVMGAHDWLGNLVQNGAVSPLQLTADQLKGYNPKAIQAASYNGQLYALPWSVETIGLYRNTTLAPQAPSTLDQAISEGLAAVKAGKAKVALDVPVGTTGDAYHMEPIYTSMGGYLFATNPDGSYNAKDMGVGKAGSIAAAKKIYALGAKGSKVLSQSVDSTNNITLFAAGKAAFMISGPWALQQVTDGGVKFDVTPVPGFAGQKPAQPFMGAQVFMVAGHGKNAAFAQQFVSQTLNTPEAMAAIAKAADAASAMTAVAAQASDKNTKVFADAAAKAAPMPAIPAMAAVWEPLGKAYAAIVAGADPTKTMTLAGKTIAKAIAAS